MTDLGDLLGLPPARRPPRSRRPCRECYRPVYVDQMICGLGRCCAEQQGLIVRRWHLTAPDPTAPTLFDRPEDITMEPFPQIRIDLAGLPAAEAHARILAHHDAMSTVNPFIAAVIPEAAEATQDHLRGQRNILARHAPRHAVIVPDDWLLDAPHAIPDVCQHHATTWPCDDYRDAAAGLATGLPELAAAVPTCRFMIRVNAGEPAAPIGRLLLGWLTDNRVPPETIQGRPAAWPLIVDEAAGQLRFATDTADREFADYDVTPLPAELRAELAAAGALFCAELGHRRPGSQIECGRPLTAAGLHAEAGLPEQVSA